MASRFVKLGNNATVYEKKGNGVLDPVLNPEDFYKRSGTYDIAGNTQTIDSLDNAYQDEINAQASAQYDPQVALAEQQAGTDTGAATTANSRLRDSIAKIYSDKAKNDPLARQGIYSGAADIYNTDQNVQQVTNANQDLTSTLKDIAGRLAAVKQGAVTGKAGFAAEARQKYQANNQSYQEQQAQLKRQAALDAADANKVTAVDLGGSIAFTRADGTIVKTVRKSATPGSGGGGGVASSEGNLLQKALQAEIASGKYTSTGEKGKMSREQLISKLNGQFAGNISLDAIKSAVYSGLTHPGDFTYVPGQDNTKPATATQYTASGFANRSKSANDVLDKTAIYISGLGTTGQYLMNHLPNALKSSQAQQFKTAADDLIAANLRKESGAAISDAERADAYRRYIPQPGDKKDALAQKAIIRKQIYDALAAEAGNAYSSQGGQSNDPLGIR